MRHFLLTSALVCSTLLLSGAMKPQTLLSGTALQEAFMPSSPETSGTDVLDRTLACLDGEHMRWLEMSVRQEMFGDEPFEAEGRYLLAPEQRMRLELRVRAAGKTAKILVVSDGHNLWKKGWLEERDACPTVCTTMPLSIEVLPAAGPDRSRIREAFLHAHGLGGLTPLLREIQKSLKGPVQQTGTWRGHPAIQVTGAWNESEEVIRTLPSALRARSCKLILDAKTLWPYRVDWIGSDRPGDYPTLKLRMDFHDPVVNQPLAPLEWIREFRFSG